MNRLTRRIFLIFALLTASLAQAQLSIEITGAGANRIPVAIPDMAGDSAAARAISATVRSDLDRSGLFKVIDPVGVTMDENTAVNYGDWKGRGADALAAGSVSRAADGRMEARFRLYDTVKGVSLGGAAYVTNTEQLRAAGHRIADYIYEKLTGEKGIFSTHIAYVVKARGQFLLQIADADGQSAATALSSSEPIISPAWSPDGRKLAVVLSKDGNSQIYTINADGSGLQRITNSSGIDTEPRFSPDGSSLYFTSDRGGSPQIYQVGVNGGDARRVTFEGSYNVSPRPSPDGKTLAFISRREGRFQLATLDLASRQVQVLTDSHKDESPSFAPNSRMILIATEIGGRGVLSAVSSDGRIKQRLSVAAGDVREPAWAPYLN
ncbi:MAG: Tol-Pal system protein TolB [Rhodocyclales bacterium]|nr:Tol-Pal system protein TolB [Rhodocyclales bacterium]